MATKNPNIKRGHTQLTVSDIEQTEFSKCARDPLYFIENYVYVRHPVTGKTLFQLYPYQRELIRKYHDNKEVITLFPRQSGKDLEITTELLTPSGFKQIKDVHPGDYVYDETGNPVVVVSESITFTDHPLYRVTFDDGTSINASSTHQWTVYDRKREHKKYTLTTQQILETNWRQKNPMGHWEYSYYIPNTKPIDFPQRDLLVDPYSLGCWLGDSEAHSITKQFLTPKIKQIPSDYMFASVQQRIDLLQGLMDAAGFIVTTGYEAVIELNNEEPQLINDVEQLIWSLGIKTTREACEINGNTNLSFVVGRDRFDLFRLPHKLNNQPLPIENDRDVFSRTITNIEYLNNTTETKCISVDNESHLFLATKALIPTHNSETSCAYLFWFAIFNEDKTILITSNKHKNAKEMISRIKYMYENLANFLKPGVTDDGWNALSLFFETGSRIISDATSDTTGRGGSFSILYCDETAFVRPTVQEEFWASISPTLATGGKLFMTSTPNGDSDLFASLWRGAMSGANGFAYMTIKWNDVPGRDKNFKEKQIAKSGLLKWQQEYECCAEWERVTLQFVDGTITSMTVKELYELLDPTPYYEVDVSDKKLAENTTNIRILTPRGYESFGGISFNGITPTLRITFTDGTTLTTTHHHKLFVKDGREIYVKSVKPRMILLGYPTNKTVVSVAESCYARVYDIIHTESHTYTVSGVASHNCVFLSSEPLLIDSMKLQQIKSKRQKTTNHGIKIWIPFSEETLQVEPLETTPPPRQSVYDLDYRYNPIASRETKPAPVKECIVTVDPSKGVGNDYSTIEVFSYPDLEQMMEFRSNTTRTGELYKILKYIWKKAEQANWSVMFTVENNGVGEGIVALYETDEHLPDNVELISDSNGSQSGMSTTNASKLRACRILKEFVESGRLGINSEQLLSELKMYVKTKGSYAAQPGGTDDCVAATLLVCRIVHAISSYDPNAFDQLYSIGEDLVDDDDSLIDRDDEDQGWDEMPMVF